MFGEVKIFGTGHHVVFSIKGRFVVFCCVNHPGLQAGEDVANRQNDRVSAQRFKGIEANRVVLQTDLHPFQIVEGGDRFFGDQAARARVHPAKENQTEVAVGDLFRQFAPHVAIQHFVLMIGIAEHKRHVEDAHLRQDAANRCHRNAQNINRPGTGLFQRGAFISHLPTWEHPDGETPVGLLTELLPHVNHRSSRRIISGMHI